MIYVDKFIKSRKGTVMITVGSLLVITAFLGSIVGALSSRNQSVRLYKRNLAQIYATELIELFRSKNTSELASYLLNLGHPLCAHINIIDRDNNNTIINADPNVDLGPTQLDLVIDENTVKPANRFFLVQVMDMNTMLPDNSKCNRTDYDALLTELEAETTKKFFVTVGLSYFPMRESVDPERVVLSTIIP